MQIVIKETSAIKENEVVLGKGRRGRQTKVSNLFFFSRNFEVTSIKIFKTLKE